MKRFARLVRFILTLALFASASSAVLRADAAEASSAPAGAPFSIRTTLSYDDDDGLVENDRFGEQKTLVFTWGLRAGARAVELDANIQGMRLVFDNSLLRLVDWDAKYAVNANAMPDTLQLIDPSPSMFLDASGAPAPDADPTLLRAGAGVRESALWARRGAENKYLPENQGLCYLMLSFGSKNASLTCQANTDVTLLRVRFALRPGVDEQNGLTSNALRLMTREELTLTNQSSAILINVKADGSGLDPISYEYLGRTSTHPIAEPVASYPPNFKIVPPPAEENPENTDEETENPTYPDGATPPPPPDPQLDKTSGAPYLSGYQDGTVRPERFINRAEAALILYRLEKDTQKDSYAYDAYAAAAFSDVPSDSWYASAVGFLSAAGVIRGYADGTFRPLSNISRAEFSVMIARLETTQPDAPAAPFADIASVASWAGDALALCSAKGFITGYPDGTFRPRLPIQRAETVAIVNRVLGRAPRPLAASPFVDLDPRKWYYGDVCAASAS